MDDARLQTIDSINRKLAPALIFAAVSAWFFQTFIMGSDLFWHLAAGREIWQLGSVPRTDPFSYTFGGKAWVNHEWLWDVLYWGVYQLGPDAVAWFTIGLLTTIFSLGYVIAYRICGSVFAAGAAVWLAAATAYWFLDIRPHVITLLLVSIVLVTREWKWAPWTWPVLLVLWTNLHAGFSFGIGMIGLLVLVRTLDNSWAEKRWVINWWQWFSVALCLVAWVVNPYGLQTLGHQWDYLSGDSIYRNLIEWRPPGVTLNWTYYEGSFFWFVVLAVLGLFAGGRRHHYLIALSGVTLTMAYTSRRFIPLFVVTATPFAALSLLKLREILTRFYPSLRSTWAGVGASLVTLVVATAMWSQVKLGPSLLRHWAMGDVYPEEAVEYLNAIGPDNGPPKRVLNYYNWGGFIMLHAPGAKVFIDGRANTLYDEAIYKDYQRFLSGRPTPERLARYPADVALLPSGPFAKSLEKFQSPWEPLYRGWSVILAPPSSPLLSADLPAPKDVLPGGIQPLVLQALAAADRGDNQQATETLEKALLIEPHAVRVYGLLVQLHVDMGSFDQASALIERGIRDNPRQRYRLRTLEGFAYRKSGRLDLALVALREAINKGPFSMREPQLRRVKELETEVRRKARGF